MVARIAAQTAVMLALTTALAGCASASSSLDRGVALYRAGRYVEARDVFDAAVRRHPDSAAAYLDRGAARVRMGDVSGGLADYTRALELSPLDPDIYYNRGNAYVLLGRSAEAIVDYSRAIALRPDFTAAVFNRGTARAFAGDVVGAGADWSYAAAIQREPATRTAMLLNTDLGLDMPSASPPTLSSVAALSEPSATAINARALATRGIARELDGDRQGAWADLQAALALEPDAGRRAAIERFLRSLDAPR